MTTDYRTKPKDFSQTLARGLRLLDLVADGREGVPVRELAAAMQLPRSIVQRLLYTLEAEGFLERSPTQVGYRLSVKLWGLGCAAIRRLNLRDVARPALEDLARKTDEMAKIGVLDGHDVVYIDDVDCQQIVRAFVPIGGRAPAHTVATGRAILAFLPPEKLAAIGHPEKGYTKQTLTGEQAFAAELEQIRKRGYAINRGEWEEGVGAIAAPVFDSQGQAIASVGVILPLTRLTPAKATQIGTWTMAAAADISQKLGHRRDGAHDLKRVG
ncbi:MAG TPA: IclR family transcriptional regulator [Xanthobacteraceae bacterium]|jgi:DNA-binding IclR family transcriptional regulator|nr:IclR family transcriptional regulator [Xanthobacteraceae bacterium]